MTAFSADIAIVGGGFSGLMTLYHLVLNATAPLRIALIDPSAQPGRGLAYTTANARHLLNVRARGMSALPQEPAHFLNWLSSADGIHHAKDLGVQTAWAGDDFAPRALYARYLDGMAASAWQAAARKNITLVHHRQSVTAIDKANTGYVLTLDNGDAVASPACLLATGNLPQATAQSHPLLIDRVWEADFSLLKNAYGPVVIIGTGLTMIDMVIGLRDAGYRGRIIGASRGGLLPQTHEAAGGAAYASEAAAIARSPQRLGRLLRALRRETRVHGWQTAMDHWRAHLQTLWAQLPDSDRKKFLSRYFTLWNVHRHRMAPAIGAIVAQELTAGTLSILHGRVSMTALSDYVDVKIGNQNVQAACVLDCRGPGYNLAKAETPLLRQMTAAGLFTPHTTGWGCCLDAELRVAGQPGLYAIGPLAIGEKLETTAVPELREQAAAVAARILADLRLPATNAAAASSG